MRPPIRGRASSTVTSWPASASARAAASPASPAPITSVRPGRACAAARPPAAASSQAAPDCVRKRRRSGRNVMALFICGSTLARRRAALHVKQNFFFAAMRNAASVPIAAGILYPVFGILLSPVFAAAAMSLSSVSVIANALRLRRVKLG